MSTTQRRDVLKVLLGAAAWPLLPKHAFAAVTAIHAQVAAGSTLQTLNPHQNSIVETIAEIIIPETHTPGAKSVKVNEFIDVVLTDWSSAGEKQIFLDGLADVDRRSQSLFSKDFSDLSPAEQSDVVRGLDEELMVADLRDDSFTKSYRQPEFSGLTFFSMMKRLTLIGYYTSEACARQETHYQIVPTSHIQCAPVTPRGND